MNISSFPDASPHPTVLNNHQYRDENIALNGTCELRSFDTDFLFVHLKTRIALKTLDLLPGDMAKTHQAVAFDLQGDTVQVALADFQNTNGRSEIKKHLAKEGYEVCFFIANPESVKHHCR